MRCRLTEFVELKAARPLPSLRPGPDGATAGVVVLHAWWGLNDDVLAYAERLADEGYAVLAPDMFEGAVATEIEDAEKLSAKGDEGADKIAFAAVDALAERLAPDAPLAVLGFSFGAAYAIWAPSERDRLSATVVYYGSYYGPSWRSRRPPFLGHFAEHDDFEPDRTSRPSRTGCGRPVEM